MKRRDNYAIQMAQAKKHFLTYDQQEIIARCGLHFDDAYFYFPFLSEPHRLDRRSGHMERYTQEKWRDANSFGEVMTVLDWLCDSRPDRYITGRWINVVSQGPAFHTNLQEGEDKNADLFDADPEGFCRACRSLKGEEIPGADIGYAIELVDGLCVFLQLWHGDEEFPPHLRCLWDENTTRYIRYETTWYAVGVLMQRLREKMGGRDLA